MMCGMAGCLVVTYTQLGGFCLELHDLPSDLFRSCGLSTDFVHVAQACLPKEGAPTDGTAGPGAGTDLFALLAVREVLEDLAARTSDALPDLSELRRYVALTNVKKLSQFRESKLFNFKESKIQ